MTGHNAYGVVRILTFFFTLGLALRRRTDVAYGLPYACALLRTTQLQINDLVFGTRAMK